jgi:hypothetical protein
MRRGDLLVVEEGHRLEELLAIRLSKRVGCVRADHEFCVRGEPWVDQELFREHELVEASGGGVRLLVSSLDNGMSKA